MRRFKQEFLGRKDEINIYFEFVLNIDNIETYKTPNLIFPDNSNFRICRDLQKVLRSNCFVMLYNLVESTLRNGLLEIYDEIHDNKLGVNDVSKKIKDIWLNKKSLDLGKVKSSQKFKKLIELLINDISNGASLLFNESHIGISGNLDFRSITEISNRYGFHGNITTQNKEILKSGLLKVKQKRNFLAHGNESFTKASELTTISDLNTYKTEIIQYLTDIVNNISYFLDNEKYRKNNP